ncbi:unnamed protein product [Moneuplotes crassus]|uniref:Uncharacterized protein n=1 Tax=Euplotes crassus TaxID=5936 RepID=A0AAD1XD89_EUPCR|nr:unnamed protein product [Moneuplotes crassus]
MECNYNFESQQTYPNLVNYKGIHHNEEDTATKYFDKETGAHFKFSVLCSKLKSIKNSSEKGKQPVLNLRKMKSKLTVLKIRQKLKNRQMEKNPIGPNKKMKYNEPFPLEVAHDRRLSDQNSGKPHLKPIIISSHQHLQSSKQNKNINDFKPNYRDKIIRMRMNRKFIKQNLSQCMKGSSPSQIVSTLQTSKENSLSDHRQQFVRTRDTSNSRPSRVAQVRTPSTFLSRKSKDKILSLACLKESRNLEFANKRSNLQSKLPKIVTKTPNLRDDIRSITSFSKNANANEVSTCPKAIQNHGLYFKAVI